MQSVPMTTLVMFLCEEMACESVTSTLLLLVFMKTVELSFEHQTYKKDFKKIYFIPLKSVKPLLLNV